MTSGSHVHLKMRADKCWLCLRITPKDVLTIAHDVWPEEPKFARKIAMELSRLVALAYKKKRTFFCGRRKAYIIGGGLFVLGILFDNRKTQRYIADAINSKEPTIRDGWDGWRRLLLTHLKDDVTPKMQKRMWVLEDWDRKGVKGEREGNDEK